MSDNLTEIAAVPYLPLIGLAPLMRRAFNQQELTSLANALLARAKEHPDDACAYLDCSTVLQLSGERAIALQMQAEAIRMQALYKLPANQIAPGLRLLVVMGPGDLMSNTPVEFLLEESDVAVDLLYLTLDTTWPATVPEHDVMLVAMAESDANQPLLALLAQLIPQWPRPVINPPTAIAGLTRDGVCATLRGAPGLEMPVTLRIERDALLAFSRARAAPDVLLPGDDFPWIVRPLGSHAGHDLERIAGHDELAAYLERVPAERFYLSRFVDYSSADGQFRKYRVALIDGQSYLCHYAISSHWMVHYLNAGMNESPTKRAEEAEAMTAFDGGFALRHAGALRAIQDRLGLAYLGVDCAETRDGKLLVFEADNAMIVHAMDPVDLYPYKQPAMRKVFAAFRQMLEQRRTVPAA